MISYEKLTEEQFDAAGGAAFPWRKYDKTRPGMTLRDWFAGQALSALILEDKKSERANDILANIAYDIADSMLSARNTEDANPR